MQKKVIQDKVSKIRVGITHGDFNGVSYEIIIKALSDNRILDFFTPVIYGLARAMSFNRKNLGLPDFNFSLIKAASFAKNNKINLISLNEEEIKVEYGKSNNLAGKYSHVALSSAVEDLKNKNIDLIVTAPINKKNIQSDEFNFPGHTEYFANEFGVKDYLMLMVCDELRIGTVTGHIPVKDISEKLTKEIISSKLDVLEESLKIDFGIVKPKIAVLGLNPHAGENGDIGKEDIEIIRPIILDSKKKGSLVFGPFSADGFFAGDYTKYDAVLAMYHDQGLIPFKTLAFENGVNFTAGLPIVRTSPAHGTAYDKAGKNEASPNSIRSALYLAVDIHRNRINYAEINKNPLGSDLIKDEKNSGSAREEQIVES